MDVEKLTKKIIELKKYNKQLIEENNKLNRIIELAIEYIEIIQHNESYGVKEKDYLKLLDILKEVENG